jgi:hypothetical protein
MPYMTLLPIRSTCKTKSIIYEQRTCIAPFLLGWVVCSERLSAVITSLNAAYSATWLRWTMLRYRAPSRDVGVSWEFLWNFSKIEWACLDLARRNQDIFYCGVQDNICAGSRHRCNVRREDHHPSQLYPRGTRFMSENSQGDVSHQLWHRWVPRNPIGFWNPIVAAQQVDIIIDEVHPTRHYREVSPMENMHACSQK